MSVLLIFTLQCLFPLFGEPGDYTGLSITNPDTTAHQFTITANRATGEPGGTASLTIPGNGQRAVLLSELFGTSLPRSGFVEVDRNLFGCTSYMTFGNLVSFTGTDASTDGSSVSIVPNVSVSPASPASGATATRVAILNTGTAAARIVAELISLGAVSGSRFTPTVRPREIVIVDVGSQYAVDEFEGYMRISSDVPVAVWEQVISPSSRSMLRAIVPPAEMTELVGIHFVVGGNYGSNITLINAGQSAAVLTLSAFDEHQRALGPSVQVALAAGEALRKPVADFLQVPLIQTFPGPVISGFIRVNPAPLLRPIANPAVVGSIEIYLKAGELRHDSMLIPISSTARNRWIVPFFATYPPFYTGYTILSSEKANVVIDRFAGGFKTAETNVISSGPLRFSQVYPPGNQTGYLRFESDVPIYVLEAIGTTDDVMLDQVPPIPQ